MSAMVSQIPSLTIVYSTVYSGTVQRKHRSSASLAFVRGIHRSPVNSPHKGPVTREMLPFDDVIMSKIQLFTSLVYTRAEANWLTIGFNNGLSIIQYIRSNIVMKQQYYDNIQP